MVMNQYACLLVINARTRRLNDNIHAEAAMWAKARADGLRVILPTTWDVH
jgi:hypothetical protein